MSDQSDEIKYLDFELTIDRAAGDEYLVRATSGEGKAEGKPRPLSHQESRGVQERDRALPFLATASESFAAATTSRHDERHQAAGLHPLVEVRYASPST